MQRIGILTYYRSLNPGVFWQAYATYRAFADLYPRARVELIRLARRRPPIPTHSYRCLPAPIWDLVRWSKFRRCNGMMQFSERACETKLYGRAMAFIESLGYDLVVVGSDTCLELCHVPSNGISPYWLSPKLNCRKMLCAASARDTSYERISETQRELLRECLTGFQLLGVRDVATATLLRNLTQERDPRIELVPDPTFHLHVESVQAARYLEAKGVRLDRKSVLLHLPPLMPNKDAVVAAFRKAGYQVLSFSPLHKADFTLFDISPLEWAGVFQFVEATVTVRFHDSVFSLKHGTPLLTLVPAPEYIAANGDSKHRSLLKGYGLEDLCLVENWRDVKPGDWPRLLERVQARWSRESIMARNEEWRGRYLGYVRKSLDLLT